MSQGSVQSVPCVMPECPKCHTQSVPSVPNVVSRVSHVEITRQGPLTFVLSTSYALEIAAMSIDSIATYCYSKPISGLRLDTSLSDSHFRLSAAIACCTFQVKSQPIFARPRTYQINYLNYSIIQARPARI